MPFPNLFAGTKQWTTFLKYIGLLRVNLSVSGLDRLVSRNQGSVSKLNVTMPRGVTGETKQANNTSIYMRSHHEEGMIAPRRECF